jgi:hypothetical protein
MPQVAAGAAVGAGVSTGVAVATGTIAASAAAAYFAQTFVTTLVLGAISQALAEEPEQASLQGQTVTSRNPVAPHNVVYGRTRVGGNVVYMAVSDKTVTKTKQEWIGGEDGEYVTASYDASVANAYLHIVIAIAGHEIDAVEQTFANEEALTFDGNGFTTSDSTYGNKIRYQVSYGDHTTQPFPDLVTETSDLGDSAWTNSHLVRGSALAYIRLEYDVDKFPNGVPNFSFKVRGKKVYDPRTSSTAWSANSALCLNDYLTSTRYGLGCVYADEIDSSALVAAANVCDEDVALDAGGTENRYECHGVFSTGNTPSDIINRLLSSMAGKAVWSQGKWKIIPGVYYTPEITFTEDDLRAGMRVQTLVSRRESFNAVKGKFSSSDDNYVLSSFPQVVSSAAVTEDGEEVFKSIELPFTTSASMAQRLAKIELLKARQQITLTLSLKLQGLKAAVGDIVNVTNTRLGWSAKKFEVVGLNMVLGETPGVDLDLREISTDVFDWSTSEEQAYDPAPNTNLPNAFSVDAPTELTLVANNVLSPDGTAQSGLFVTWTTVDNAFVEQYEVQYIRGASNFDWGSIVDSPTTSNDFGSISTSADSSADYGSVADATAASEIEYNAVFVTTPYFNIVPAIAGAEYAVRVRAISALGVRSAWITSNQITYGDRDAPDAPSAVVAYGGYRQITVSWINTTVSDFDYVEVWRNNTNTTSGATRVAVLRGSMFVDAPLAINVTRYYFLRSVDRTGNISGFTAGVSATTEFVDSDSFSQEVLNLFAEAGAYGIEPVATLPETGDFDGQIKYDTTNNKLWRWDGTAEEWTDDIFSIESGSVDEASFASGIEPVKIVSELPNPSGYTGAKVVFLTTDNKLYRYDGSAWVTGVSAGDIDGTLGADNFSQDLRPVERVSALPASGNFQGRVVVLTTDNKLYRYTGTGWTAAVPSTDISGTLTAAQIASVTAAQVTGQLTNAQIEEVAAAKLTGSITETQISDGAISTNKLAANSVSTAKLAAGSVTADVLAANSVTSAKIESGAITTAKLAAGSVTADELAANSVTASKVLAGEIGTDALAANAITAGKIAAGAIEADALAANAVTAGKIAAGAISTSALFVDGVIESAKIKAGDIQGDRIAANTITGGLIAASGIITSAAQIDDAVITNAKIENAAVDTLKIAGNAVTVPSYEKLTSDFTITNYTSSGNKDTIFEITANTDGEPVYVLCDIAGYLYDTVAIFPTINFYLQINGTTVISATQYKQYTERRVISTIYETPPTGNFTISLLASKNTSISGYAKVLCETSTILLGNGGSSLISIGTKR